jgi:hypothetical protein
MVRQNGASPEALALTAWAYDMTVLRARALSDKILQSLQGLQHRYPAALPASTVDALREYHAQAPSPGPAGDGWDRRGSPRFPVAGSKLRISAAHDGGLSWEALELDRSWRGFAFLSDRRCEVGSILTATEADGQAEHPPAWAEVKSCRPRGDAWVIGCELLPAPDRNPPA